ncbi:MAG: DUF2461 domain-containing protein [Bacteroidetes bacterium]|nr:MAG: DUF2461 domain-containing protein [Bacteroidota bacterium]
MHSIIPFLQSLSENNNRDWFTAHKKDYEKAQKELSSFLEILIAELAKAEPELTDLKPKDCLFRIYRDVRFSKNKDPYKTNMGAVIAPGGRKSKKAFYYLHLSPESCFLAGGQYVPEADKLKLIRQEIDYNLSDLEKIVAAPEFKKYFQGLDQEEKLKNAPKGYELDNPALDYLKLKSFTVSHEFKANQIGKADFLNFCLDVYAAMRPFNGFLNQALDA